MEKHLALLGWKVKDKVTGYTGVVTHVGLDMFGCVQAIVLPEVDKKGPHKVPDSNWFDTSRLAKIGRAPVMKPVPMKTVESGEVSGSCHKPTK